MKVKLGENTHLAVWLDETDVDVPSWIVSREFHDSSFTLAVKSTEKAAIEFAENVAKGTGEEVNVEGDPNAATTAAASAIWTHIFVESGNGFPQDNELVLCMHDDGEVDTLRITETSPIHTSDVPGRGNYLYCRCVPNHSKWDDYGEAAQDALIQGSKFVQEYVEEEDVNGVLEPDSELCDE